MKTYRPYPADRVIHMRMAELRRKARDPRLAGLSRRHRGLVLRQLRAEYRNLANVLDCRRELARAQPRAG